ncbi:hypothetical protein RND81_04G246000 [Saponaria officinalis]|uniref:PRLI-interacting factor A n=1 Tax=Saponaria officinalis TaxID=3572 RepID=A0AAW1LN21_SAPOF
MNDQSQIMDQHQMAHMVGQQAPPQAPPQMVVNQAQMMGQSYGQWTQTQTPLPPHSMAAPPVIMNAMKFPNPMNPMYVGGSKPVRSGNNNWKGKKPMDKRRDLRRKDNMNMNMNMNQNMNMSMNMNVNNKGLSSGVGGGYQPPTLYELEQQNRLKARRFYHPKKKFNRMGPYAHAPRNTTSYIIRAKKSGGIASLVSPCPVTPAVLPTPVFSPSREALVDMAKEEWGVDGYGSMKGLIRLRSPGQDETVDDYDEEDEGESSESDVEEHVEVERRLDHDLSRFEMIYPNTGADHHNLLENRVDDQDTHIAQLEEENLILKERLYLMEREFGELRRRLLCLERQNQVVEDINEEVVENLSENDSEGLRNIPLLVNRRNEEVDFVPRDGENVAGRDNSDEILNKELKELAVKESSRGEAMESDKHGAGFEGTKCEDGLFDDVLGNKCKDGVEHDQELAGELCESVKNEDLGSVDGAKLDVIDDTAKGQSVGDIYMTENVPDQVNDNDRPANAVDESEITLKMEDGTMVSKTQAEDVSNAMNNKVAGDVCMGDMVSTGKTLGDDKSEC